jgi:hypothetical protein
LVTLKQEDNGFKKGYKDEAPSNAPQVEKVGTQKKHELAIRPKFMADALNAQVR